MNGNVKNLPYVLELLDDATPVVRDAVRAELLGFGDTLDEVLKGLNPPPSPDQREQIRQLLLPIRRQRFEEQWSAWYGLDDLYDQLETAYQLMAEYLEPDSGQPRLAPLLDRLAGEYREQADAINVRTLSGFLFHQKAFRGAHIDYYSPENSNLVHVLQTRRGIPLSLTCLLMLVGKRVGLAIQGCNFPGHFLARSGHGRDRLFIDCFDRGKFLSEVDLIHAHGEAVRESLRSEATAKVILERMLRNLVQAFRKRGHEDQADFMMHMLEATREALIRPRQP